MLIHEYEVPSTDKTGITKNCVYCGDTFLDITKRGLSRTCGKKCARALGVAKRRANGTYVRTEEQNRKSVETCLRKYGQGSAPKTIEGRARMSAGLKSRWADGSMQEKSRESCRRKYGTDHWTQSTEGRKRCRVAEFMKTRSKETAQKMQSRRWRTLQCRGYHNHARGRGGKRPDLGDMYFRSQWEANIARMFNVQGFQWVHEPHVVDLPDGRTYTPDFHVCIDGVWTWVEVKGYEDADYMGKWRQFCEMKKESGEQTLLINAELYKKYEVEYSCKITEWEH